MWYQAALRGVVQWGLLSEPHSVNRSPSCHIPDSAKGSAADREMVPYCSLIPTRVHPQPWLGRAWMGGRQGRAGVGGAALLTSPTPRPVSTREPQQFSCQPLTGTKAWTGHGDCFALNSAGETGVAEHSICSEGLHSQSCQADTCP